MQNIVEVDIKNVYGKEVAYPVNETAKLFCQIAGTKTLTQETWSLVSKLGYQLVVIPKGWDSIEA